MANDIAIRRHKIIITYLLFITLSSSSLFFSVEAVAELENKIPLPLQLKHFNFLIPRVVGEQASSNDQIVTNLSKKLTEVLQRRGPNLRASSDYHDFNDIYLNESIEAWKLMHKQSEMFSKEQTNFHRPMIINLLKVSNVSESCQRATNVTFDALERLESWAVRMWSSTGNFPPVGIFDGQYTDLGSFIGCLDSFKQTTPMVTKNIGYTSYCLLAYRPVIPSRPKNHMVFNKLSKELTTIFDKEDIFTELSNRAQYFYYLYLKTGICVPHQCSAEDIQRVANFVGLNHLYLMTGPIKCYTRAPSGETINGEEEKYIEFGKIEDEPILINLEKPISRIQLMALIPIMIFYSLVLMSTIWHVIELCLNNKHNQYKIVESSVSSLENKNQIVDKSKANYNFMLTKTNGQNSKEMQVLNIDKLNDNNLTIIDQKQQFIKRKNLRHSLFRDISVNYLSIITNLKEFIEFKDIGKRNLNEIKCLHGIRVITMCWVILVHSFQYNSWDGFTRIFESQEQLQNIFLHPFYNASYVVDNFFFMSGLLVTYTIWSSKRKNIKSIKAATTTTSEKQNKEINASKQTNKPEVNLTISLLNRYLRLTPQVLLISLLYILLPLFGEGPFWYDMTHYSAKYCEKNWWVNLLHLQSFYRKDEICNLVGWWISVDMFYFVVGLFLIYLMTNNRQRLAVISTLLLVLSFLSITAYKHFVNQYEPNNLGTVPQVGEVWTGFVVDLFWSPYAHVVPFYLGFWSGYLMAKNKLKSFIFKWSRIGNTLALLTLLAVNLSSHIWMSGYLELGNQFILTTYNTICSIAWSASFAWCIFACHYNCVPKIVNDLLSLDLFVLISKASFIIYLSHMLLLRIYFGSQLTLLEDSNIGLSHIIIGNIFISILFGLFLCVTFEGPFMKFQKLVTQSLIPKTQKSKSTYSNSNTQHSPPATNHLNGNNKDSHQEH